MPDKIEARLSATVDKNKAPVFDKTGLMARLMDDEALARKVVKGYLEDIPRQIEFLKEYVRAGGTVQVERQAHTIKGASANVGGEAMRAKAFDIEKMAKAGDLEAVVARVPELESQFARLKKAMDRFINQDNVKRRNRA